MATTTNYGWTTPDDTALVKDGAAAIRTLGSSVDTSVKALNPGTTAGDLDYYTAATTKARIAKGTAGQVFTMNSGATAPEWATAASAVPANSSATVATSQTTTSTSYTDLATSGPAVTVTTGTKALVIVSCKINVGQEGTAFMSYAVSGATTVAGSDAVALQKQNDTTTSVEDFIRASSASLVTLTAGSNTFTAKYRSGSGAKTATFASREIFVINLA
jgi:hypothetical protein